MTPETRLEQAQSYSDALTAAMTEYLASWRSVDEVTCYSTFRGHFPTVDDHPRVQTLEGSLCGL